MPAKAKASEIEADLRAFALVHEPADRTESAYKRWRDRSFGSRVIVSRHGSFREALKHFGLECSAVRNGRDIRTIADLIDHFEMVWEARHLENLNRTRPVVPTEGALTRFNRLSGYDGPCAETYRRTWGSFPEFVRAFASLKRGEISKEDLKEMAASGTTLIVPNREMRKATRGAFEARNATAKEIKQVLEADNEMDEAEAATVDRAPRREPVPTFMRLAVLGRANGRCEVPRCGRELALSARVDHVIPVSAGGQTQLDNLRATCEPCNRVKSDSLVEPIMQFFHLMGYNKLPNGTVDDIAKKWRGNRIIGEMLHDLTVIARWAKQTKGR